MATASYEARAFGVHSGMPLTTAYRRCPDAVFLPSDRDAYDAASEEVWNVVRELPVVTEVWGWDEAVLGSDTDDPESLARADSAHCRRAHRVHLLRRDRGQQAAGQDRDRVRQGAGRRAARGRTGSVPSDEGELARGHG